jgi:hypothetical protein
MIELNSRAARRNLDTAKKEADKSENRETAEQRQYFDLLIRDRAGHLVMSLDAEADERARLWDIYKWIILRACIALSATVLSLAAILLVARTWIHKNCGRM